MYIYTEISNNFGTNYFAQKQVTLLIIGPYSLRPNFYKLFEILTQIVIVLVK